jgi:hypothetical protein
MPSSAAASLTSLARLGVDSGGTLTERTNDSIQAWNAALSRLSCTYSLGFKTDALPESRRVPLTVIVGRPNLQVIHPAFYVRRTESAKRESRLLAAFVDPAHGDDGALRALVIPRGGDGSIWNATLQVRLLPSGVPDRSLDLGASIVSHNEVTDRFATSIATKSGSRPAVLEQSVDIEPGAFSVVAVAHDVKKGDVWSRRIEARWPDLAARAAAIAPIAALQPGQGAILRDGRVATAGTLARDVDEMLDPSLSVSLRTVVCRGADSHDAIVVERWLEGGARDEFAPMTIAETGGPCVQVVDGVPRGRFQPGEIVYHVAARIGDEVAAEERRTLRIGAMR